MKTKGLSALIVTVLVLAGGGCSRTREVSTSVHTDGRWIKDAQGRVLLLRGANVGSATKLPPFIPFDPAQAEENFTRLKGYGFTLIRFLMIWEGIEPSQDAYDTSYLDTLEKIVDGASRAGLYVFLDMHQDVFSRAFCGDGAPEWAAVTNIERPPCPPPWPYPACPTCTPPYTWFTYYFTPATMASFDNFWTNPSLQEHFISAFLSVVKRFRDHPAVIGYEIFNEPFPGSVSVTSPDFEEKRLQPFYEKIIPRIRLLDPDSIIFFEPSVAANFGGKTYLTRLPFPNVVLAPHYYEFAGSETSRDKAMSHFSLLESQCRGQLGNIPWVLGEFGVGTDDFNPFTTTVLQPQLEVLDELLVGWTYWNYNAPGMPDWNAENMGLLDDDGKDRWMVDYVSRPYPRKTAGIPTALSFSITTKVFRYTFEEDPGATGPTEIFVPASRHYGQGFTIQVSDGETSWDASDQILSYTPDRSRSSHSITISPQ